MQSAASAGVGVEIAPFPLDLRFAITEPRRSAGKVNARLPVLDVSDPVFVAKCLDVAYPAKSQHAQCIAVGADLGHHPETIRRWITGVTHPSLRDFWPVLMRVVQIRGAHATYRNLIELLASL
jgi:hypothetical protein